MKIQVVSALALAGREKLVRYFSEKVPAGFPSPAQDYNPETLDLNEHLIKNPAETFIVKVVGDSMIGAGISDGDELIVDRSLTAKSGDVVIAIVDNDLTVKRLVKERSGFWLCAENVKYPDIFISPSMELSIWGVVIKCLHNVR